MCILVKNNKELTMVLSIMIIAVIGAALSVYACVVEQKIKNNPQYKPACDLSDVISCSKPMTSEYSTLFMLSNAQLSLVYYCSMIFLALMNYTTIAFYCALGGVVVSIGLAYILYFKIKALCLVCTSMYLINIALVVATYLYL